jgi:hypothetical protein
LMRPEMLGSGNVVVGGGLVVEVLLAFLKE